MRSPGTKLSRNHSLSKKLINIHQYDPDRMSGRVVCEEGAHAKGARGGKGGAAKLQRRSNWKPKGLIQGENPASYRLRTQFKVKSETIVEFDTKDSLGSIRQQPFPRCRCGPSRQSSSVVIREAASAGGAASTLLLPPLSFRCGSGGSGPPSGYGGTSTVQTYSLERGIMGRTVWASQGPGRARIYWRRISSYRTSTVPILEKLACIMMTTGRHRMSSKLFL